MDITMRLCITHTCICLKSYYFRMRVLYNKLYSTHVSYSVESSRDLIMLFQSLARNLENLKRLTS